MHKQPHPMPPGGHSTHAELTHPRSQLPQFAIICLQGGPIPSEWSALEAHLDGCAACREELEELLELLDATAAGTLPQEQSAVTPELIAQPLLPDAEQPSRIATVVQFVTAELRRLLIEFSDALHAAMRQPSLGGAFRSHGPVDGDDLTGPEEQSEPAEEFRYELNTTSDDITVAIDFALKEPEHRLYEVRITVIAPDRDPYSQDGHHVTLHYEAQTAEGKTNSAGCIAFQGIPYDLLPQLQITITPRPAHA